MNIIEKSVDWYFHLLCVVIVSARGIPGVGDIPDAFSYEPNKCETWWRVCFWVHV